MCKRFDSNNGRLMGLGLQFTARMVALSLAVSAGGAQAAADPPWFTLVTTQTGLTGVIGRNISVVDVNGDGYLDLLLHLPLNEAAGDVLNKQFLYLNRPTGGGRRFVVARPTVRANALVCGANRKSASFVAGCHAHGP